MKWQSIFLIATCSLIFGIQSSYASAFRPDNSILIGAYWIPYPDSSLSWAHQYQRIADANIDAIINVSEDPGNHTKNERLSYNTQTAMTTTASATTPILQTIIQYRNSRGQGTFQDYSPNLTEVNTAMNLFIAQGDTNIYGWNTWDEPGNILVSNAIRCWESSMLDSMIRVTNQSLSGDSTWTTFVGWFENSQLDYLKDLLNRLDYHDGVGWGRRPVFGMMQYRFREFTLDSAAFPIVTLNSHCLSLFNLIRENTRLYHDTPNKYPWWSAVHITDEPAGPYISPPSENALRADVFTRLAWGAKGIFYYSWMRGPDDLSWEYPDSTGHWPGVYATSTTFNDVKTYITNVNEDIRSIRDYIGPAEVKRPIIGKPYTCFTDTAWLSYRTIMPTATAFICSLNITPNLTGINALASPMVVENGGSYAGQYVMVVNQYEINGYTGETGGPIGTTLTLNPDSIDGTGSCLRAYDLPDSTRQFVGTFVIKDSLDTGGFRLYGLSKWNGSGLTVDNGDTVYCQAPTTLSGSVTVNGTLRFQGSGQITCNADITINNGGVVEIGENVTVFLDNSSSPYKKIFVNAGGTLCGKDTTSSIVEGPIKIQGFSTTLESVVENLKVQYFDYYGYGAFGAIEVNNTSSRVSITDCWIDGCTNGEYGIHAINSDPTITGCRFTDLDVGVYAYNGADCILAWYGSYDECSDCSGPNNTFDSDCITGIKAYLNSEYQAGNQDWSYGGCNNFLRSKNSTGYHVYFVNTNTQNIDINYWKGGVDLYESNGSHYLYVSCPNAITTAPRQATLRVSAILTAIEQASEPAWNGDVTTALTNLRTLALQQDTILNALFVLDRVTEIIEPNVALEHVDAIRQTRTNENLTQSAIWIMARLENRIGNNARAMQWYETVEAGSEESFLTAEATFVRAEHYFNSRDTWNTARILYERFLSKAAEGNPSRDVATRRIRYIQTANQGR